MAITAIPSLHLKPVAYKTSKVYAKLPTGSAGNFTFTRNDTNASRTNKEGLVEFVGANICRFDYPITNGVVGSCPEILNEPSRTNLFLRSQELDNASWIKTTSTVLTNSTTSPDGTNNADKINVNTTGAVWAAVSQDTTTVAETVYAIGFYVKPAEVTFIQIGFRTDDVVNNSRVNFELTGNGTVGTQGTDIITASIILMPKGWYYINATVTTAPAKTALRPYFIFIKSLTDTRFKTNNWTLNDGLYIWGLDLQLGSYITSHIKTVASTVTRVLEQLSGGGDVNTFNSLEGVLYLEIKTLYNDGTSRRITISDGTTDNRILLQFNTTSNEVLWQIDVAGVTIVAKNYLTPNATIFNKIAIKWANNDFALIINGVEVSTDVTGAVWAANTLTTLDFRNVSVNSTVFYGRIRDARIYKTLLINANLIELTT